MPGLEVNARRLTRDDTPGFTRTPPTTDDEPRATLDSAVPTELMDALLQTTFMTMAELNGVATDSDPSLTQLRVLAILRDRRVRMSVLAAHLGLRDGP